MKTTKTIDNVERLKTINLVMIMLMLLLCSGGAEITFLLCVYGRNNTDCDPVIEMKNVNCIDFLLFSKVLSLIKRIAFYCFQ